MSSGTKSISKSKKLKSKSKSSAKRTIKIVGISGTPGSGKTTLAMKLEAKLGTERFGFLNIADLIKTEKLYSEWDDEMNCSIFDAQIVRKEVEKIVTREQEKGKIGIVIEFHSLSFLKRSFLDKIFVLQTDTNELWKRLEARKYSETKIRGNIEAEIFMECLHECQDKFGPELVVSLDSNSDQDMERNIQTVSDYLLD